MRVSLVTETYFPQVNGVSRTLGELVRHLTERGDQVQLIHPNYGEPASRPDVHLVRSVNIPFYKELYLPLPPFGSVRRAINVFRPDVVHIATEATLGLTVLRHVLRRKMVTVSSFHTNFDQYSRHYRIGWANGTIWRYLRWFHNRTRETYVPSLTTINGLKDLGFERLVLWPRGVDSVLFRPDRPGRQQVRQALGWGPDDLVISYVSRIAPEKNVSYLADALAIVAARRPDVRILFVGDGPTRTDLERRIGAIATIRGLPHGRGAGRFLLGRRPLCFHQPYRDLRQRGPGGDGVGDARGGLACRRRWRYRAAREDGAARGTHRASGPVRRGHSRAHRGAGPAPGHGRSGPRLRHQPELGRHHGRNSGNATSSPSILQANASPEAVARP